MSGFPFWKMHGTGNDFVVMRADDLSVPDGRWSKLATAVCDRHLGVGADGLILVQPSDVADRKMRIFNADGSDGVMCVNGIRCFVKFCLDQGLVDSPSGAMRVETNTGVQETQATRGADGLVEVVRIVVGVPELDPASVGVSIEQAMPVTAMPVTVEDALGATTVNVALVSMGNPHAVNFIEGSPRDYPLERIGPLVEHHTAFADRTNYEVVRVTARDHLEMRVWERGVGETLACGSGACAVVVAARVLGYVDDQVDVAVPGGILHIEWDGEGAVVLTGPVARVFTAEWEH
ncbi:MAG: diaminopimelate epimerase [Dehalococcoidia bacterium]|nr:diaminopimelate epimerase [Dehalococcoidia bacterium]